MPDRAKLVLLLHGFTHTGASWQPVLESLGEPFRALTPDVRGHGSASNRVPVDLAGVLSDLAATSSERFGVVGYSMGGRLALHLALAEPRRVARLVLIGASPGLADPAERAARRRSDDELAREIESTDIEAFARRWARTPILAGLPPELSERVHQDRLRNSTAGLARALRGLGTGALPSLWPRLGELPMPVVIVVGERDAKFQAIGAQMVERLAQAQLLIVPGAGHAVHLEAPRRVAEITAAALRDDRQ
jgi:2-succinyl-6-hydroxy-2,4-cyclohexadiene-1-carboxylate synthase